MPQTNSPLEQLFLEFAQFCHQKHLEYVFVGGITVQWLGTPRSTFDIDIILHLPLPKESLLVEFLQQLDRQFNPEEIRKARGERSHFSVFHPENPMFRYDIRLADTDEDYEQISNAITVQ